MGRVSLLDVWQFAIAGKRSPSFGLPAGVLQGSVLSPILYSVYIDPLVAKLRSGPLRILSLPLEV